MSENAKEIKVLIKEPGHNMFLASVPNKLGMFQALVDGYIEPVPLGTGLMAIVDADGKLKGKEPNGDYRGDVLVGTVVIAGVKGTNLCDVPNWYVQLCRAKELIDEN